MSSLGIVVEVIYYGELCGEGLLASRSNLERNVAPQLVFHSIHISHTLCSVCGGPTCRVLVTREPVDVHLKGILSRTDKHTFLLHEVIVL